jgi:hypothetical protein
MQVVFEGLGRPVSQAAILAQVGVRCRSGAWRWFRAAEWAVRARGAGSGWGSGGTFRSFRMVQDGLEEGAGRGAWPALHFSEICNGNVTLF